MGGRGRQAGNPQGRALGGPVGRAGRIHQAGAARKVIDHKHYINKHGDDMPEIAGWRWGQQAKASGPQIADTGRNNA